MIVPMEYMPRVKMKRIIMHWTAGRMSQIHADKMHYHGVVGRDLAFYPGADIRFNAKPLDREQPYAAHTLNYNEESIGLAMAGMALAQETPTGCLPGPEPITEAQYEVFIQVVNQYALFYQIPVTRETVFSHAEAPMNGVPQRGKWDFTRLPWCPGLIGARAVGDKIRRDILALRGEKKPITQTVSETLSTGKGEASIIGGSGTVGLAAQSQGDSMVKNLPPAAPPDAPDPGLFVELKGQITELAAYGVGFAGRLLVYFAVGVAIFTAVKYGMRWYRGWRAPKPNAIELARGVDNDV